MTEETGSGWPQCQHANVRRFRLGVGVGPDSPDTLGLIEPRWCHDCGAFKPAESEPWYQPKSVEEREGDAEEIERQQALIAELRAELAEEASSNSAHIQDIVDLQVQVEELKAALIRLYNASGKLCIHWETIQGDLDEFNAARLAADDLLAALEAKS